MLHFGSQFISYLQLEPLELPSLIDIVNVGLSVPGFPFPVVNTAYFTLSLPILSLIDAYCSIKLATNFEGFFLLHDMTFKTYLLILDAVFFF